jgi:uncharacterized protein (DUF305 family)
MLLPSRATWAAVLLSVGAVACQNSVPSGAQASATPAQASAKPTAPAPPSDADVAFMQGMIGHHTQAIEMVKLLMTRTTREDMKLLGQRIQVAQTDEIKMMKNWLRDRQKKVPDDSDYQMMMQMPDMAMPGMLTQKEMDDLAAAKGATFDRLFLEGMIKHHQGALTMVDKLSKTAGGAQDSAVFAFASEVQADQSAEIQRMRAMRATMGK